MLRAFILSTSLAHAQTDQELAAYDRDAATMLAKLSAFQLTNGRGAFYRYCQQAWAVVEPSNPFLGNWHLEELCDVLETMYWTRMKMPGQRPRIQRTVINVPPGTAKSLVVNVLFPTWCWAKNPRFRFLFLSYGAHLTTRDNLRARQLLESSWFQERWHVRMSDDQDAKTRYNTEQHGWRIASSVRGVGTGEHPDFIIIDDPTSAQQAMSEVERTAANEWFDNTLSSRLGRNPYFIVIMQRLHEDDLSGHLLKRGGWDHVRWPMRFEKCTCPNVEPLMPDQVCPLHKADPDWKPDPRDRRTEPGELLFPALFPEDKVRQLELDLGPYGSAGQLQQRPSPEGGGLFKREWFKFVDIAPTFMRVSRGWDTASTEGAGDSTAGVKCGEQFEDVLIPAEGYKRARKEVRSTGRFYLMDPINEKLSPAGVDALIKSTAQRDGKEVAQREEKEGGSAGKAVVDARTLTLKGFNYAGVQISGSKVTRAKPFRAQLEAGNVYLVGTPAMWDAYIRELCGFPAGSHDDYVDATSCAFNSVLLEEPPRKVSIVW